MKTHAAPPHPKRAENATTSAHRVRSVDALRMALADKSRGQRIAALRNRKHLTQQAMAERLKIAYRTYQTWEAGTMPEWDNLEKLAKFHSVRVEDIVGEDPDVMAMLGSGSTQDQIARLEGELAATRAELGTLTSQVTEILRLVRRLSDTAGGSSRNRKAK